MNETDVIMKIRSCADPEQALQIATDVILSYLTQTESFQSQLGDPLPEYGAAT